MARSQMSYNYQETIGQAEEKLIFNCKKSNEFVGTPDNLNLFGPQIIFNLLETQIIFNLLEPQIIFY